MYVSITILFFLIAASGMFSGLTVGLMGFSSDEIRRMSDLGNPDAKKILPFINRKNLLLTTLLLGNTAVNATISIFLGSLVGEGFIAGIAATGLILLFGEILPAATLNKYALKAGGMAAPLVRVLIFLFYPVAAPVAFMLDRLLGPDLPDILSRKELLHIIESHHKANESDLDRLDRDLLTGVLSLPYVPVKSIMTPAENVTYVNYKSVLSYKDLQALLRTGYTRFPVIWDDRIAGIINIKKMLMTERKNYPVSEFCKENKIVHVRAEIPADDLLNRMIRGQFQMAAVTDNEGWTGIITLEDIFEIIAGRELSDEFGR